MIPTLQVLGLMVSCFVIFGAAIIITFILPRKNKNTFDEYIKNLKGYSESLKDFNQVLNKVQHNVAELHLRDKDGKLFCVYIAVGDGVPSIPPDGDKPDLYMFSTKAAQEYRERGIGLDEVVTRILRDSGRIT